MMDFLDFHLIVNTAIGTAIGPVYYELQVPMDVCLPEKRKDRERTLSTLGKWIRESAHCMQGRNTDLFTPMYAPIRSQVWHEDCATGAPLGIRYEIKLLRTKLWPPALHTAGREPGTIVLWNNYPDEDETNHRHFKRLHAYSGEDEHRFRDSEHFSGETGISVHYPGITVHVQPDSATSPHFSPHQILGGLYY